MRGHVHALSIEPGRGPAFGCMTRGWPLPDLTAFIAVARLWSEARAQLTEDLATLKATYGTRWAEVPCGHGDVAAQAKEVLATGIVPVRPASTDPVRLVQELGPFLSFTVDTSSHLLEQASLLGESLGADLSTLTLHDLRRLGRAVLRLSDAPPPNPAWCRPAAAAAASVALAALGEDVRAAAATRDHLYRDFTEDVWRVPVHDRVDRWWQCRARARARTALTEVSRNGRPPANVKATVATLRRAAELRGHIDHAWTSLRGHLGWFAESSIPDADGASSSLAAVQELHAALGDRVDTDRLADLAAADAFVCPELTAPAEAICDAIAAWNGLAKRFHGPEPLAFTAPELVHWAAVTSESLDVLRALRDATAPLRPRIRSVAEILDDAVVRDRVEQLQVLVHEKGDRP